MRQVRVAVAVPALEALSYRVPDGFAAPAPGSRVLVPLGTRIVAGVVIGDEEGAASAASAAAAEPGASAIKDIVDVIDSEAFLPADVVTLCVWVAEYYACGAGEAIGAAMPPRGWIGSERFAQITDAGQARL